MIELIFIIAIIGILSAIAVPKLAENRDNAMAKICITEASSLITEMSAYYIKNNAWDPIQKITNIQLGRVETIGNKQNGLTVNFGTTPQNDAEIVYICNGEKILSVTPQLNTFVDVRGVTHNEYELDVPPVPIPSTQPSMIAVQELRQTGIYKTNPGYRIGGN